jgi:hypothetical protein
LPQRRLVEGLRSGDADANEDGFISVDELYDYVCERVRERAPGQTPGMAGDVRGDIRIARSGRVAAGLPPEVTDAMKSPLPSVRKGVVNDLAQLLRSATPGVAAAAEEALVALANDDSRQVSELAGEALEDRTERRTPASSQREPITLLLEPESTSPRSIRDLVPRSGGRRLLAAGAVVATVAVTIVALGARGPSGTGLAYDFDGDGRQEVVLGAFIDPKTAVEATVPGRVLIHEGPGGSESRMIEASFPGVNETPVDFGRGLASADFNGDDWADLAISAPSLQKVAIRYGSSDGLQEEPDDVVDGSRMRLPGLYGWNLVASDLDGDRHADLVVGAPGDDDQEAPSGAVQILFGGPDGLNKEDPPITIRPPDESITRFGARLRVGHINRTGGPDLVEGAPDDKTAGHGTYFLDVASPSRVWRMMKSTDEQGTSSLAVADVDGDGDDDVVQGDTRNEGTRGKQATAGEIRLWKAGSTGLSPEPEVIRQASLGLRGEKEDEFGAGVEAADLDGDGRAELIAGAPGASSVYVIDHRGPRDDVAHVVPDPDGEESRFGFGLALLQLSGVKDRLDLAVVSTRASKDAASEDAVRVIEDVSGSSTAVAPLPGLADELTVVSGETLIALGRRAGG